MAHSRLRFLVFATLLLAGCDRLTGRGNQADALALPADAALVVGAGEIDVEGGILPLSPLPGGIVRAVSVAEGQEVKEGDALLELDATSADLQLDQAKLNVAQAALQLDQARQAARQHGDFVKQQELAVEVAQHQITAAKPQIDRLERMVKSKLADEADLQAARDQLVVMEKTLKGEQMRLEQARRFDAELAVRQADAQKKLAEHQVVVAQKQRGYYTLTAPTAGVVLRVLAKPGQLWSGIAREPAVWFRPAKPWVVRCEIDQQFIGRVRVGMPCEVHDDRADGLTWKGVLKSVSGWVGPRRVVGDDPSAWRDVRVVECIVSLEGPSEHLRIGQRVRVVIREGGP